MRVRIGVLGPVTAVVDGQDTPTGSPLQRAVLAALAIRCPNAVPRSELTTMLWGDQPPASAAGNVQTYVANLRRLLEPHRPRQQPSTVLVSAASGYQLQLAPDAVDAHRFTVRADAGFGLSADGHDEAAVAEFEAALAYWRGPALAGLPGPFASAQQSWYAERRLDVLENWSAAKLRLQRYDELVEPLRQATADHPLRERLTINLIEALAGGGHRDEALATCEQAESVLAHEFGMKPGPELSALRARLVGHVPPPSPHVAVPAPTAALPKPAQLPHDVASFVGRAGELATLRRLTAEPDAPRVVVLHGQGGSGKTALATHFGFEVAEEFPDGQLYVNLRGFEPDQRPMPPDEALMVLLHAIGVPQDSVPARLDQRQGYLRTLLAGTRTLLVLDNAASAVQVRPLLPGSAGCFAMVTSRNRLRGLVVSEGAATIAVGLLAEREALDLLGEIIGTARVEREPEAARLIADVCGLLPLLLRIAAERAAMRPQHRLTELAAELTDEEQLLDVLSTLDERDTARALFSWSYTALPERVAHLFRVLSLFPGPEISIETAAALAGAGVDDARGAVRELVDCHLLEEHLPNRYRLHDLMRIYSMERLQADEPDERRHEALRRLLDWYLQCAVTVDRLLAPERISRDLLDLPQLSVSPPEFTDRDEAMRWCEAEGPNIVPIVRLAADSGYRRHAWQVPHCLIPFFHLRSRWQDWLTTLHVAVRQCRLLGDRHAQARCEFNRTVAYQELGRHADVLLYSTRLLESDILRTEPILGSFVLNNMGVALLGLDRPAEAAERLEDALHRQGGDDAVRKLPNVATNLGNAYTRLGRYAEAKAHLEKALACWEEVGDDDGQSECLLGLGDLYCRLEADEEAAHAFRQAYRVARRVGSVRYEAQARHQLGGVYTRLRRFRDADAELRGALAIFDQLYDATGDEVRQQLWSLRDNMIAAGSRPE